VTNSSCVALWCRYYAHRVSDNSRTVRFQLTCLPVPRTLSLVQHHLNPVPTTKRDVDSSKDRGESKDKAKGHDDGNMYGSNRSRNIDGTENDSYVGINKLLTCTTSDDLTTTINALVENIALPSATSSCTPNVIKFATW
jgi:hypothetical protein